MVFWNRLEESRQQLPKITIEKSDVLKKIITITKYLCSFFLIILGFVTIRDWHYCVAGVAELSVIAVITDWLLYRNVLITWFFNSILLLVLNIQFGILFFGGSYVSAIMLDNVGSLEMLKGKALIYIIAAIMFIIISFLPVWRIGTRSKGHSRILSLLLAEQLIFTMFAGNSFSAYYSLYSTVDEIIEQRQRQQLVESMDSNKMDFYHSNTYQYYKKPEAICKTPNIVLIFAEGMSERIISDERNITPNIAELKESGLSFNNYYNHTAATYRGIIGSLFSGYQLGNLDKNGLVSLQGLLKENGYRTGFINVEPGNASFTGYLESLGFDEVVDRISDDNDSEDMMQDREAYEELFHYMEALSKGNDPFMIGIYTVGTHVSWDSPGEVFGDGSSNVLNRFYYMDIQFGLFLERFRNSSFKDNTVLIFTTDHCSYADNDYLAVFDDPDGEPFLDEIPFIIYYDGIEHREIDAGGRNSLCLAPTICDLLDIEGANYFLGTTLFCRVGELPSDFDTIYCLDSSLCTTLNGNIDKLQESQEDVVQEKLLKYYVAARE